MTDSKTNTDVNADWQHASLAELVAIRDGEQPAVLAHVAECEFCQARLEEVHAAAHSLQQAMLFEAELPVPSNVWKQIEQRMATHGGSQAETASQDTIGLDTLGAQLAAQSANKTSIWSSVNTALYSLAAAVVFTGLVSLYTFQGQQQTRIETQALQASIQNLMDNSRGLESVLQKVATQNGALAAADSAAIERLQWRLMMVDQKINESESSEDITYEQIKELWADRIDALSELNQLYYTNQVAANEGEI